MKKSIWIFISRPRQIQASALSCCHSMHNWVIEGAQVGLEVRSRPTRPVSVARHARAQDPSCYLGYIVYTLAGLWPREKLDSIREAQSWSRYPELKSNNLSIY